MGSRDGHPYGRGLAVRPESVEDVETSAAKVTENSHGLHADLTPARDTQRA